MSGLAPISTEESKRFDFLFSLVRKNMGFIPNSIKTMARVPALMGSFSVLTGLTLGDPKKLAPFTILKLTFKNIMWSSRFVKSPDRVPLYLRQLVGHMASKAAGCLYCQAHTIGEAQHSGATTEQLESLWEFESSTAFSEKEKTALRFGLAAGSVPNTVTEDHFKELREHFSEEQIIELGAVVALFGFLNRWNDTFATELESIPNEAAEKFLKNQGWSPGKHKP